MGGSAPRHDPFAGFSSAVPMFVPALREDGTRVLRLSPARSNRSSLRGPRQPQREFLTEKPENLFRVFVIGASSAAGMPYSTRYAFSTWLERRLEAVLPDYRFEVVNAALSGYASRRLLLIAREIAGYAPDLVILYMGHNELAARQYYAHLLDMDPRLFRAWEWIVGTHLYGFLSRILPIGPGAFGRPPPEIRFDVYQDSLQMFAVLSDRSTGKSYPTERELAYRDHLYEFNLDEIARTMESVGSRLMFLTLSQNFSDWRPGASSHRSDISTSEEAAWQELVVEGDRLRSNGGDCAAAISAYSRAMATDDEFADLHYRLASCHRELGQLEAARKHYRRANDLDRVPHGAPTHFNDIIRSVARKHGALVVDIDQVLTRESSDGLVGSDLFVDFIHPNLRAHQKIAAAVANAMREAGLPAAADRWEQSRYTDPDPASLYLAEPRLRLQELQIRIFTCLLARREDCASENARQLLALEPENRIARQVLARLESGDYE